MAEARDLKEIARKVELRSDSEDNSDTSFHSAKTDEEKSLQPGSGRPTGTSVIQSVQKTRNASGVPNNGAQDYADRTDNPERNTSEVPKVPDRQNSPTETAISTDLLLLAEISEENNETPDGCLNSVHGPQDYARCRENRDSNASEGQEELDRQNSPGETAVSTDVLAAENSEDNNTETPDRCPNTVRGTQDYARRSENPERDIPEVQEEPDRQNALTETPEENYVLDLNENAENPDECLDTVDSFEPLIEGRSDLNANVSTVDVFHVAMVYRIMSNQSSPHNAFKYLLRNAGLRGNLFEAAVANIYQAWRHVTQYAYSRVPALLNKVQESPGGLSTFNQLAVYKVQSLLALVEGNKDGILDTLTKASALLTIPFQPGIATQVAWIYLHYGLGCSEGNQKKGWMTRAQTLFRQDSNDDADDGSTDDIEARCGADIVGHGLDESYQSTIPLYYQHQFYQFYKKLVQQPIVPL